MLGPGSVVPYLRERGVLGPEGAEVEVLSGGVSNVVLGLSSPGRSLVVKQALAKLRVPDEWFAPEERAMAEADALSLAGRLAPANVPRVIDRDPFYNVVVLERAPRHWRDWKSLLLEGEIGPPVGARLGSLLACWHKATAGPRPLPASLEDGRGFEALRVDPYYRTVARRAPALAEPVLSLSGKLLERKVCLVHGDFSPKNVLVGPEGLWVVDWEVAHRGDPAFDVAFMLCHLVLKSLHMPGHAGALDRTAEAFARSYEEAAGAELELAWPYVLSHVACLVLARVKGKSPAEYLSQKEREEAWRLGTALLAGPPGSLEGLASRRDRVVGG